MRTLRRFAPMLLCAAAVEAQDGAWKPPPPAPRNAPDWGVTQTAYVQIPPSSFRPRSHQVEYNTSSLGESLIVTSVGPAFPEFHAGVSLPSGAQIVYLELDFSDTDAAGEIIATLVACDYLGQNCTIHPDPSLTSGLAFAGGLGYATADLAADGVFVNNYLNHYAVITNLGSLDVQLRGAVVGYRLRVSPPPASATFNDVPVGHQFFQHVEALVASGITAGCGGGNFCPNQAVTRGQMAAFLALALGLHFP